MNDVNIYIYTEYSGSLKSGAGKYHIVLESRIETVSGKILYTILDQGACKGITKNRLELVAIDKALKHLKAAGKVTVYTASEYLTGAFKQGWPYKWQKNDYKRNNKPVAHADLWKNIMEKMEQYDITFVFSNTTTYTKWQATELKKINKNKQAAGGSK